MAAYQSFRTTFQFWLSPPVDELAAQEEDLLQIQEANLDPHAHENIREIPRLMDFIRPGAAGEEAVEDPEIKGFKEMLGELSEITGKTDTDHPLLQAMGKNILDIPNFILRDQLPGLMKELFSNVPWETIDTLPQKAEEALEQVFLQHLDLLGAIGLTHEYLLAPVVEEERAALQF